MSRATPILLDLTLRAYDDESGAVSDSYGSDSEYYDEDVQIIHTVSRARQRSRALGSRALMLDDTVHLLESISVAKAAFQRTYAAFTATPRDEETLLRFLEPHKQSMKLLLGGASPYVHEQEDNRFWETRIKKVKTEEDMLDLFELVRKNFPS
jgi:hypothetical protein